MTPSEESRYWRAQYATLLDEVYRKQVEAERILQRADILDRERDDALADLVTEIYGNC